jgi:NAD(P)-dependent dehydrogenase (short-subunit alcohol dehydrogenase family)
VAARWTAQDMPDQVGRVAVVTGANRGLGLVTARELARSGATVVLACRSLSTGERALAEIRQAAPGPGSRWSRWTSFVGPDGRGESRGYPRVVTAAGRAYDEPAGRRLWEVSETLSGVHSGFPVPIEITS